VALSPDQGQQQAGRVAGKVALVTGAGSGIGRAVCVRLAEEGAEVVVTSRSASHVEETCREVERAGGRPALGLPLDITDAGAVSRVVDEVANRLGRIDILSNNAGLGSPHTPSLAETTDQEWEEMFSVNVTGMFRVCRGARPYMEAGASIVNVASINAFVGAENHSAYVASKGAVMQLTRALAVELARHGIRANAVCPGVIDTPLTDLYLEASADPEALRVAFDAASPIGRLGTAREVANCVLFLASDEASFVTGAALLVDGGQTAR
jgi:NAD(P)-dependent dehydrogenase (short-subunit alcohol dehydrogenase family)